MLRDKLAIDPISFDQNFQYAAEKCCVSAGSDRKPIIGYVGPKNRAVEARGHPIPFHPRFSVRIYQHDFRSELFCFMQVLRSDRLGVGGISSEENYKVS